MQLPEEHLARRARLPVAADNAVGFAACAAEEVLREPQMFIYIAQNLRGTGGGTKLTQLSHAVNKVRAQRAEKKGEPLGKVGVLELHDKYSLVLVAGTLSPGEQLAQLGMRGPAGLRGGSLNALCRREGRLVRCGDMPRMANMLTKENEVGAC